MLGDFRGADGGHVDFFQALAQGRIVRGLHEDEAGVAANDLEQIVEIMGDAGGQRADDLHFLRLEELVLEFVMLGLVGDIANQAAHLRPVDPGRDFHQPMAAVRGVEMVVLGLAAGDDLRESDWSSARRAGSGT